MKYDIYFHNDFDGHASAAVVLSFLQSRGDDIEHYVPVKYNIIPQWKDEKFFEKHRLFRGKRNPAIIVDFPFHPATTFWFDHHVEPFREPSWQKKFKSGPGKRYDDNYASACHLAYDSLKRDFGWKPPAHLKELIKWLDVCDNANYRSAEQTIEMKEPALQINNFIEDKLKNLDDTIWLVKLLSQKSLSDIVKQPKIKRAIKELHDGTMQSLEFWKKHLVLDKRVIIMDLTGSKFGGLAHYAPYYLYPKVLYAIRFHPFPKEPTLFHINASANPWLREQNKKNIGQMLKKFGGGGHKNVGGVEIEGRTATLKAVKEMAAFLNKK